mmetsp:Transcript_2853/g.11198  ORF Transcript_2853/g.11198 Transcript_2853/m.11198 type:complete len:232 (+) Transcript_2853:135-830(+)
MGRQGVVEAHLEHRTSGGHTILVDQMTLVEIRPCARTVQRLIDGCTHARPDEPRPRLLGRGGGLWPLTELALNVPRRVVADRRRRRVRRGRRRQGRLRRRRRRCRRRRRLRVGGLLDGGFLQHAVRASLQVRWNDPADLVCGAAEMAAIERSAAVLGGTRRAEVDEGVAEIRAPRAGDGHEVKIPGQADLLEEVLEILVPELRRDVLHHDGGDTAHVHVRGLLRLLIRAHL